MTIDPKYGPWPHDPNCEKCNPPEQRTSNPLVPRLREFGENGRAEGGAYTMSRSFMELAAREIEAQADEIERLTAGLRTIEEYLGPKGHPNGKWDAYVIAGRLLRGQDHCGRAAVETDGAHIVGPPLTVEDIKEAVRMLNAVEPPPGWPGPCSEFVPDADGGYQVDSCIYCGKPRREHATR